MFGTSRTSVFGDDDRRARLEKEGAIGYHAADGRNDDARNEADDPHQTVNSLFALERGLALFEEGA